MAAPAERPPSGPGPTAPPAGERAGVADRSPYLNIMAQARMPEQGRLSPNGIILDGLSWKEGDLHRVITGHVNLEQDREEVTKRHHVWSSTRGAGYHGDPKEVETVTTVSWLHIVKSVDLASGDIVASEALTDTDLEQGFYRATRGDGVGVSDIQLPVLDRTAETPEDEYVKLPVPVEDNENIIEQIDDQVWAWSLPNWIGLTWNDGDKRCRIVEDDVIMELKDGQKQPPQRIWTIETTELDAAGNRRTVGWDTVDGVKLGETMRTLAKKLRHMEDAPSATERHLRLEVPPSLLPAASSPERSSHPGRPNRRRSIARREAMIRRRHLAAARAADEAGTPEGTTNNYHLSRDKASELLSYSDILGETGKKMLENEPEDAYYPSTEQDIESLQALVADKGKPLVFGLATHLRNAYWIDARRLDLLKTDPTASSISWSLLELARLHHYTNTAPAEAPDFIKGNVGLADPFAGDDPARSKLREILDRRIGREFALRALHPQNKPELKGMQIKDGDIEQLKGLKREYRIDTGLGMGFVDKLQGFIKDKILEGVLAPVARGEAEMPDWPQWIVMGRLLRMSVGH